MNKETSQGLPKIGYLYHFPAVEHPTDKFRLDVYISSIPTEKHFDVLHVTYNVESPYGGFERLKVTHPWEFQSPYRVCAGKVILEDRKDKKAEAFCFGGQLTIHVQENLTECNLVSPAPIIEINPTRPMQTQFIMELEILLAEYRAEFNNESDFEKHVCAADPFSFYVSSLNRLIEEYTQRAHKDDQNLQFLNHLHNEHYRLQLAGLLIKPVPRLEELFPK